MIDPDIFRLLAFAREAAKEPTVSLKLVTLWEVLREERGLAQLLIDITKEPK